jgi:hypothetical protein
MRRIDAPKRIPRTLILFGAVHFVVGLLALVGLFQSRCVDEPLPPGTYMFDGCTSRPDPWREGYAPPLLISLSLFVFSSLWLLRASHTARALLPLTLTAYFALSFYSGLSWYRSVLSDLHERAGGLGETWTETWKGSTPLWLLIPALWILLDAWFLYGSPVRKYFQKPPNKSLERSRER